MNSLTYDESCSKLWLERLELRRLHADLICCFNIINGLSCLLSNDFFKLSEVLITRGNSLKLALPNSRVDCRLHFFSVRIIKVWNCLPEDIVTLKNVSIFKNKLKSIDLSSFIYGKL